MQQLSFNLPASRARRCQAESEAAALVALLRQFRLRLTAQQIGACLGWTDRQVRQAAEAAGGQVLSAPGIAGYRLAATTPVSDYYAQERLRYRSQIRAMSERLLAMDRAVHAAHQAGRTVPGEPPKQETTP